MLSKISGQYQMPKFRTNLNLYNILSTLMECKNLNQNIYNTKYNKNDV